MVRFPSASSVSFETAAASRLDLLKNSDTLSCFFLLATGICILLLVFHPNPEFPCTELSILVFLLRNFGDNTMDLDIPGQNPSQTTQKGLLQSLSDRKWESFREDVRRIYMDENQTLPKTMVMIDERHHFKAS